MIRRIRLLVGIFCVSGLFITTAIAGGSDELKVNKAGRPEVNQADIDDFWEHRRFQRRADDVPLTQEEITILASIIELEYLDDNQMEKIAGVYINRLEEDMHLDSKASVRYALGQMELEYVREKHREFESSYNTFLNKGLPPEPLCTPSKDAFKAVLDYEEHDYLYFIRNADLSEESHVFTKTKSEYSKRWRELYLALRKQYFNNNKGENTKSLSP